MIEIQVQTTKRSLVEITQIINENLDISSGLCNIFSKHTSASVVIIGSEDKNILLDTENLLAKIIDDDGNYLHNNEVKFDATSHLRTLILGDNKTIPVKNNQLNIGKFQGVFLYEHKMGNYTRTLVLTTISDAK